MKPIEFKTEEERLTFEYQLHTLLIIYEILNYE